MHLRSVITTILIATIIFPAAGLGSESTLELNNKGVAALEKGEYRKAITHLYEAYKLDKSNKNVRKNLATAYNNYGTNLLDSDIDRGIKMLRYAAKFDPTSSNIKNNLASAYNQKALDLMDQNNISGAENYLLSALNHTPKNKTLHENLSIIYTRQGLKYLEAKRLPEARSKFNLALSYDKENAHAYLYAGDIYYQNQSLSTALKCYRYALELNPEFTHLKEKIDTLVKEQQVEDKLASTTHRIFDIRYDYTDKKLDIRDLLDTLEEAYIDIGAMLNYYPNHKIVVLLYPKDEFQKIRKTPHWVGGLYDGKIRLPGSETLYDFDRLRRLIRHEYTHALIHDLTGNKCSVWLNEGLAKFMEYSDKLKKCNTDILEHAFEENQLYPIATLEQDFIKVKDERKAALLYQESFSIIEYIYKYYGFWKLRRMVDDYGKGYSTPQVILTEFNQSVADFELSWMHYLKRKF